MAKDADQESGDLMLALKQLLVISCFGITPSLNTSLNYCGTQFLNLQNDRTGLMFSSIPTIHKSMIPV